jgi:(2Fe-2S) ferredoxin
MTPHGHASPWCCNISVCRDCCCGTSRKHPDVDHDLLVRRLEGRVGDRGRVTVSTCLLACDRSNVVVVSPSRQGRSAGGSPVWLKHVLSPGVVDAIASWVHAGGPGLATLPAALSSLTTRAGIASS